MASVPCKLRKCQGRRGCLCVKSPPRTQVFAGVNPAMIVSPAPKSTVVNQRSQPTVSSKGTRTSLAKAKKTQTQNAKSRESAKISNVKEIPKKSSPTEKDKSSDVAAADAIKVAESGADVPDTKSEATNQDEDTSDTKPEAQEPVTGSTMLRYNHYKHTFNVTYPPGEVDIGEINERFSFSYGFKGDYKIHLRGPGEDGLQLHENDNKIIGVELDKEYWCFVEEDPEEAKKERKSYKASGSDAVSNARRIDDGSGDNEDKASCSCIEGNPCAVAYNCKDWSNRFEVAKKHGWKGF